MNAPLRIRPHPGAKGFTLVEMLVSVAVLALMMVLVAQLVNGASAAIGRSGKHMDSDTEARLLFNRMAVDLSRMVKRTDVDYSSFKMALSGTLGAAYGSTAIPANLQPGNDMMAFYADTDGYFSGATQPTTGSLKASISLAAYMVANDLYTGLPGLQRLGKGQGWDPGPGGAWGDVAFLPLTLLGQWPLLFNGDPDYKTVGSQVFRFEYTYLLKPTSTHSGRLTITPWDPTVTPAHTSINGFKDVAAIVVAIAVLDTTSRAIVTTSGYATLASAFPDALDSSTDPTYLGDIAPAWNAVINSTNFASSAGIPKAAAAGVRVYERYFYLDTQQ